MDNRGLLRASSRLLRRLAGGMVLAAGLGASLWLPLRVIAQQADPFSSTGYTTPPPAAASGAGENSTMGAGSNANSSGPSGVNTRGTGRYPLILRRRFIPPSNPLVIVDSLTGSGNPTANYNQNGTHKLSPIIGQQPQDYTLPADPAQDPLRREQRRLPLFGYDFFQPARQIILARRRALLGPILQRSYGTGQNTGIGRNRTGNGTASPNGYNANGAYPNTFSPSSQYPNNAYPNGTYPQDQGQYGAGNSAAGPGAYDSGNGAYSANNNGDNSGNGQPNYAPGNGASNNPDFSNPQNDTSGQYPPGSGSQNFPANPNPNGLYGIAAAGSAAAAAGNLGVNGNTSYPNTPYPNAPYGDPNQTTQTYPSGTADQSGTGTNPNSSNDQNLNPNQNLYPDQTVYPDQTDTTTRNSPARRSNPGSYDANNSGNTDFNNSSDNSSGFGASPYGNGQDNGTASEFGPQDPNSINALAGEITDPIATLYKNIASSLPPNYQLQPGDSLTVRYSTFTVPSREFTSIVDSQGGITVQGVGRVVVAGRTAAEAEDVLRRRLERLYKGVDVSITLRQLRTIQVTVSGAAFAPGTYTVPAAATAFNVLNAAGGPTADGSLREVRVLRNGRLVGRLDLYPLLGATGGKASAPGSMSDINLQPGDIIYIPARFSRVAVRGEVRQPAIFELTPTETLHDALAYAGGVKPSGVDQMVHIDTEIRGIGRELKDVNLRDAAQVAKATVYDGDTVDVASVRSILLNRVTVEGAVDQPGDYALVPGMRVADLLQRARGPLYNAYLSRADLTRLNSDNTTTLVSLDVEKALDLDPANDLPLARFDRLRLYTRSEVAFLGNRTVTVRGEVQRPGLYTRSDNEHVRDLLLAVGGPLPDAYLNRAVLLHQRSDGSFAYDYVNIGGILSGDLAQDVPLQDNDILAVYRVGEAHFTPDHVVTIRGSVVSPGIYPRGEGMHLSDLLKLAGTFRPGGGSRVTVAHARRPLDQPAILVAAYPSLARVAFNGDGMPTSGEDLLLQDGDVVAVQGDGSLRDHPSVITVSGAVNRPGPIILTGKERLSDAVREAGGLRPEAFPQGAEFTRDSTTLVTTGQLGLADIINQMSDMLNLSQYQRERAKANLELITAAGSAASGSSGGLAIPGISPGAANASNPNAAPLIQSLTQYNLVSPGRLHTPSQLQPNGNVAVRLVEALRRPGAAEDILLKDGDTLVVPETPTTVQVIGAVFNPRGIRYRPGQSIDYYIQNAGDVTPDAARDRIEVIHAGGGLLPASKAGALQPGDLILVPTKVLAEKISQSGNGFSNFFQALTGSAITLKVLSSVFGL